MDLSILHWIQENLNQPFLISLFKVITALGNGGILWIGIAIFLSFKGKKREALFLMLTLLVTSTLINCGLKLMIQRPRPFVSDVSLIPRIKAPLSTSFPSGHSASSFCCAAFLWQCDRKKTGKMAVAAAVLIALSRLILLVHYPSDVLAGSMIGASIGIVMHAWMKKLEKSEISA